MTRIAIFFLSIPQMLAVALQDSATSAAIVAGIFLLANTILGIIGAIIEARYSHRNAREPNHERHRHRRPDPSVDRSKNDPS